MPHFASLNPQGFVTGTPFVDPKKVSDPRPAHLIPITRQQRHEIQATLTDKATGAPRWRLIDGELAQIADTRERVEVTVSQAVAKLGERVTVQYRLLDRPRFSGTVHAVLGSLHDVELVYQDGVATINVDTSRPQKFTLCTDKTYLVEEEVTITVLAPALLRREY